MGAIQKPSEYVYRHKSLGKNRNERFGIYFLFFGRYGETLQYKKAQRKKKRKKGYPRLISRVSFFIPFRPCPPSHSDFRPIPISVPFCSRPIPFSARSVPVPFRSPSHSVLRPFRFPPVPFSDPFCSPPVPFSVLFRSPPSPDFSRNPSDFCLPPFPRGLYFRVICERKEKSTKMFKKGGTFFAIYIDFL